MPRGQHDRDQQGPGGDRERDQVDRVEGASDLVGESRDLDGVEAQAQRRLHEPVHHLARFRTRAEQHVVEDCAEHGNADRLTDHAHE